jgi:magnesium-transporting ATPase (P-type)
MQNDRNPAPLALPFSRGIAWLLQSLSLMRRQTGRLLLIAVIMQVILGLTQVPLIGLLIIISVPGLSAGMLEAFDVTKRGGHPGPNLLLKPLMSSAHTGRLLLMGALVFVVGVLSISLVLSGNEGLIDPDLMSRLEQGDMDAISQLDQESISKMALAFLIGISVSGTLSYFTIPLIWFSDRKLFNALADGFRALLINWRPFLMLALGLTVALVPVAIVTGMLIGLATQGGFLSVVVMGGVMILLLAFQLLLFGTQYCSFQDIFGVDGRSGPPVPENEGQLVA